MALRGGPVGSSSGASTVPGWRPEDFHRFLTNFLTEGVARGVDNALAVSERGAGANMSVDVATGIALIEVTTTLLSPNYTFKTWLKNDAVVNVAVPAADLTNPRKDRIVAVFDMTIDPNGSASDNVSIELVEGTPDPAPSAPATPSNAISLAIIDVPASDTSISSGQITDDRSFIKWNSSVWRNELADGGTGSSLSDPGADRIFFWDESANASAFLTVGNGLSITTTTIAAVLASIGETNTGTATDRAVTPDGLAGSVFGSRSVEVVVFNFDEGATTGDGAFYFTVPEELNGMNLIAVHARCITAGTTNPMLIQIHNVTQAADMLSTRLQIDSGETGSDTAATAAVIDTGNDDVATNDLIRIDVDQVSTTPQEGLIVRLRFQLP
jgi:hypothetical protein